MKEMNKMRYCTNCITPESAATIAFDSDGICNICRQAKVKHGEIVPENRYLLQVHCGTRRHRDGRGNTIVYFLLAEERILLFNYGML